MQLTTLANLLASPSRLFDSALMLRDFAASRAASGKYVSESKWLAPEKACARALFLIIAIESPAFA